jgi:hypothetical protein
MHEIRVLAYTDSSTVTDAKPDNGDKRDLGLYFMKKAIDAKSPLSVKISILVVNRHDPEKGLQALTPKLLADFDELWVFGTLQRNIPATTTEPAILDNELTEEEVAALRAWMDAGGGVLITGDHANPNPVKEPEKDDTDHSTFQCLGRAIGRCVPRAGELRVWDGPPTTSDDNINTQVPDGAKDPEDLILQEDAIPQRLDLAVGRDGPHFLFWREIASIDGEITIRPIDTFPDHMHEGAVIVPPTLDPEIWPEGTQPVVVATGVNQRDGEPCNLVVAYDGGGRVGRIVADSTWHHYFNVNLRGFPKTDDDKPLPDTDFEGIAQFYVNLALWLAPGELRDRIAGDVVLFIASHPLVFAVRGSPPRVVESAIRAVVESQIGVSNMFRILLGADSMLRRATALKDALVRRPDKLPHDLDIATLGRLVHSIHEDWVDHRILDPSSPRYRSRIQEGSDRFLSRALIYALGDENGLHSEDVETIRGAFEIAPE